MVRQGFSRAQIAAALEVSYNMVKKWSYRGDYRHKYNTVQKRKITPTTKLRITGLMKDRVGSSIRKCVRTLNMSDYYTNRGKHISRITVRRYVRSQPWGRIARKLVIKPLLTKQNVTDRLSFALNVQMEGYCGRLVVMGGLFGKMSYGQTSHLLS